MKKTTLFLCLVLCFFYGLSQTINQAANWPNNNWSIDGTYDSTYLYSSPLNSSNFSFDDDDAGSGSDNIVAAQSPIIDITGAQTSGETFLNINTTYVFNVFASETITVQYWDNDSSQWVNWGNTFDSDTPGAPTLNYCTGSFVSLNLTPLDVSGFTASQLQNFRYRIYYNDNQSYGYGFCFTSPTLVSQIPTSCANPFSFSANSVTSSGALLSWEDNGSASEWTIEYDLQGFTLGNGNVVSNITTTTYSLTTLLPNTPYEIYLQSNCSSDNSSFIGPITVTTLAESRIDFSQTPITVSGNYDIAVVDMNGDFLDDIVGVSATNINIQQQNNDGSFTSLNITTPNANYLPSWSIAAADYDANGKTDLLYGAGSGVTFMRASADGTSFTEQSTNGSSEYTFSQRSNFIDINNDGHLDAFVCHDVEPNVYFINNGSGQFTFYQSDVTVGAPFSLGNYPSGGDYGSIWIDYNNDRNMDLFVSKCGGSVERRTNIMMTNNGDGSYTENATEIGLADPMQTWSSAWGDFDNDGDMDVFVGASSGAHKLMRNNGFSDDGNTANDYTFTDVTSGAGINAPTGWESTAYDIDNDGNLDIISNGSIMYGNGDLTFSEVDQNQLNYKNGSFGDLNNDGFIDAYYNGTIYLNQTNTNNWVKINTVGTAHINANHSNINGIGARIELVTNNSTQIRDVRSGEGFEFMSTLNTHFGIGTENTITEIRVYWPSGVIDVLENPSINTTHTITEGTLPLSTSDSEFSNFNIYPNPANDFLNITFENNTSKEYIATIFDNTGKKVLNKKITTKRINISQLNEGIYLLRLESEGRFRTLKFIKK